jgi:antitoxin ParD1/3/4
MNVSLTPERERLVNEKVASGLYQTASEVVREALRLLKERDQAREQLRADVQAGVDQLARGEGRVYDKTSARQLAERIKSRRARPEFGPGVRSFAVENYVIYDHQEIDILIARILHGRRDQIAAWSESS